MTWVTVLISEVRQHLRVGMRLPAPISLRMLIPNEYNRVQRKLLVEFLSTGRRSARLAVLLFALAIWPYESLRLAFRFSKRYATGIKKPRNSSLQFLEQVYFAWFHGLSPYFYYAMGFSNSERPKNPAAWIQSGHASLLTRVFRRDKALTEINDKLVFSELMNRNNIPAVPVLAAFENGAAKELEQNHDFDIGVDQCKEIFVKPRRSSGGEGASIWKRNKFDQWSLIAVSSTSSITSDYRQSHMYESLCLDDVARLLFKDMASDDLIVQNRVQNHPKLQERFGNGLVSIRVVSGITCGGDVMVLRTVLYAPLIYSISSQKGFVVDIDKESGRLGKVFWHGANQTARSNHPETSVGIEGYVLPFWKELLTEIHRAHRVLPSYPFLGWDLAICEDGPVVIEANGNFATDSLQKTQARPLIDQQFLEVFNTWMGA